MPASALELHVPLRLLILASWRHARSSLAMNFVAWWPSVPKYQADFPRSRPNRVSVSVATMIDRGQFWFSGLKVRDER
jgi:hypothetical protein